MTLLDRYILKEWLKVFGMALGAMVGLLMIGQVYDRMADFIQWKTPGAVITQYYLWQIPALMPIVLPVAALVSMLFLLGHLHKNQELTAMRAAGLSVWRITRVLWAGGAACTVVMLILNSAVIPQAMEATRTIRESAEITAKRRTGSPAVKAGETQGVFFANGRDNRIWRIASLGAYTGQALGVRVYEVDEDNVPRRQISAEYAKFDAARGCWIFENGRDIAYASDGGEISAQPAFKEKVMTKYTERPINMLLINKKPSDLSLGEIRRLLEYTADVGSSKSAELAVRYHGILAGPFSCLVVVGLAIPFAVAGVRTNPMIGVSKAIGVFALYYLFERVAYAFGSQQVLPPVLAAWIPNLVAIGFALRLCRRVA